MSPDRMPRSSEAVAAAAVMAFIKRGSPQQQGFLSVAPRGWEQPMKHEDIWGKSQEGQAAEDRATEGFVRASRPIVFSQEFRGAGQSLRLNEQAAEIGNWQRPPSSTRIRPGVIHPHNGIKTGRALELEQSEKEVAPWRVFVFQGEMFSLYERHQALETTKPDAENSPGPGAKAIADYLATEIGNSIFRETIGRLKTASFPETEPLEVLEETNELLETAVDSPLKALGTMLGLSPGEASVGAGITANFILAPITAPLDKAESYIEVGGMIAAALMGPHALAVAFIKPFLHSQLNDALSRILLYAFRGPRTARPEADSRVSTMPQPETSAEFRGSKPYQAAAPPLMQHTPWHQYSNERRDEDTVEDDALRAPREATPNEPLWLCVVFKPNQPEREPEDTAPRQPEGSDSPHMESVGTGKERDETKPIILPVGHDGFSRLLLAVIEGSTVSEADMPTAQIMSGRPAGGHSILRVKGTSFGTFHTASGGQQAAYQHPGCLTGRCVPPGSPLCLCPCTVCRAKPATT